MPRRRVAVFDQAPGGAAERAVLSKLRRPGTGVPMAVVLRGKVVFEVQEVAPTRPASWMVDQSTLSDGSLLVCTPLDLAFVMLPLLSQTRHEFLPVQQILARGDLEGYRVLGAEPKMAPELDKAVRRVCEAQTDATGAEAPMYRLCMTKCRAWFRAKADRTRDVLCAQELAKTKQGAVEAHIADAKGATAVEGFSFGTKRNAGSVRATSQPDSGEIVTATKTLSPKRRAQLLLDALAILSDYVPSDLHAVLRSDLELEASLVLDEDEARRQRVHGQGEKEAPLQAGEEEAERVAGDEAQRVAAPAAPKPKRAEPVIPVAIRRLERVDKRGMSKLSTFFGVKKPKVAPPAVDAKD